MKKQAGKAFSKPLNTPALEQDPAKNAAADQAIAIIMNEAPSEENDDIASWGVPNTLLAQAGAALANRHCFAIDNQYDELQAMITPIRHFEKEGACSDQSGPVDDLLPHFGNAMESTWECYDEGVKSPVDLAKHLQALGFQWSRNFQDFIDKDRTKEIAAEVQAMEDVPAAQKTQPAATKAPKASR